MPLTKPLKARSVCFNVRTQCVPRSKHCSPRLYTPNLLVMCKAKVAVYSENRTQQINTMYHIEFLMSKLMVHKVISKPYKVNVNCWMPPYADKSLRDCSHNSWTFGNMTVRKTPGSAL